MYKINNIPFTNYGILAGVVQGENIALKGCFDLPKRIGDTHYAWADEDGVQPFVDADEIFLDARVLEFAGVLMGSKTVLENNIKAFKTLISTFTDLVLLETPYGSFSVLVKSIKADVKEGAASLTVIFTEPEIGLLVNNEIPTETVYNSVEFSETAIKNNCESGYSGTEVTLTSVAGAFTSILSQVAANQLAIDWVREQKQEYANVNGSCTLNPPIFYNTRQSGSLFKNNCATGFEGSNVAYTVEPFTYSSLISQADANAKALAEIASTLTQAYANENGTCTLPNLFYETENTTYTIVISTGNVSRRRHVFFVAATFPLGTRFFVSIYGILLSYVSVANDTRQTVITALVNLVNATTSNAWNAANQAPVFGGNITKPLASATAPPIPNLFPQFFTPQLVIELPPQNYATVYFEIP